MAVDNTILVRRGSGTPSHTDFTEYELAYDYSGNKLYIRDGNAMVEISGDGTVDTSGTPVAQEYARFTDANTIEGRSAAGVRTDLGLNIGTNVQAYDTLLKDIADIDPDAMGNNGKILSLNAGLGKLELVTPSAGTITSVTGMTNNNVLTASGSTTISGESSLQFAGQFLSIQGNDPSNTYGVKEKLRIHRSGANTDRQLQIYEMRHSGGREFLQAFNLDITTDNSSGYTYTQGSYGGSSYIEFDNGGALKFYNDTSVSSGSRNAITPSLSMWIGGDNNILMPGKLGIGWTSGTPNRALDVKGGIELSVDDNTIDTNNFTLRRGSSGVGHLDSPGNIRLNIDSNNNQTTAFFEICANASTTPVFKVGETGIVTTGTWNGTTIASAYLDADTAHLSGSQTFSGNKTFSASMNLGSELNFTGNGNKIIDIETLENNNHLTIRHHNPIGNVFENAIRLTANAGARLYYDGGERLQTTSDGALVTGVLTSNNRITSTGTDGFTIGNYSGYDRIVNNSNVFRFLTDGNAYANMQFATVTTGTWQGTAIANAYVADLPASKITSGTLADARIPSTVFKENLGSLSGGNTTENAKATGLYQVSETGHSTLLASFTGIGGSTRSLELYAHYNDELYFRTGRDSETNFDSVGRYDNKIFHSNNSTSITSVGTIGTGTWQGTAIASAYLDADTAHLSGTQTFSGAKTFSNGINVGGLADGGITGSNYNITGVNAIAFQDPGAGEGLTFSNFQIFESPDNLSNAAGNIQFVTGGSSGTRRATIDTSGNLYVQNNITLGGTVDGRNIANDGSKLDGIESGATADQTAAQILTAIKTVDGPSSGLNADLLDNLGGGSFLRSDAADTAAGNITFTGQLIGNSDATGLLNGVRVTNTNTGFTNAISTSKNAGFQAFSYANNTSNTPLGGGSSMANNANWGLSLYSHGTGGTGNYGLQMSGGDNDNQLFFIRRVTNGSFGNWFEMWHSGNDGSGSGLDADTVDGVQATNFVRKGNTAENNTSNRTTFNSLNAIESSSGHQSSLEVFNSSAGNDAFMQFHVSSDFALYFGLDGSTNDLAVGGWSMGANKYKVWHAGNDGAGSGLDADTLDGLQLNSSTRNNQVNTIVRTQANGYAMFGWINTTSGNTTSASTDYYVNTNDGYIRKKTLANVRTEIMGVSSGSSFLRSDAADTATGALTLSTQTWNGHITWNNGQNIYVAGESSFDVSGSGVWQVWDSGNGEPFIKCDVGQQVEIGDAGNRGLKVHGNSFINGQLRGGFGAQSTSGTTDWNHSTNARSGNGHTLLLSTHTNGPGTTTVNATNNHYYHLLNFEYAGYDNDGNMTQLAFPYSMANNDGARPVIRTRYNGTWSSYNSLVTANANGQIQAGMGTAALPSITFNGGGISDTNTGILRTAADTIGFSTNGVTRFTMNGGGVLYVSSHVQAGSGGIQIWDGTHGFKTVLAKDSTYTKLLNNDGTVMMYMGDSGDAQMYYQANEHRFRNLGGSTYYARIGNGYIRNESNGSAAAPAFSWTNDPDLGFYRNGANNMRFSAGNAIRGTWNGDGLVLNGGSLGVNVDIPTTDGVIRAGNDVIAFYSSDERLKENVKPIENALDKVSNIRGVEFDWIVDKEIHANKGHDVGVIAQEIEKVLPEVVETRDNGYKAVKYEKIVSLLIEAVKEQQVQIDELKTKLGE